MSQSEPTLRAALRLLGLATDADREQVISAYRRLARTTHPDVCAEPDAAARFDTLTAAYRRAVVAAPPPGPPLRPAPVPTTAATMPDEVLVGSAFGWGRGDRTPTGHRPWLFGPDQVGPHVVVEGSRPVFVAGPVRVECSRFVAPDPAPPGAPRSRGQTWT